MPELSVSLVAYRSDPAELARALRSVTLCRVDSVVTVIDNSPDDSLRPVCAGVRYVFSGSNRGFGAGHNLALREAIGCSRYCLMMNPDIHFDPGTLEALAAFMDTNPQAGSVMPRVLYEDGSLQYVCRLIPDPLDVLLRKVESPLPARWFKRRKDRYDLRFADYGRVMNVPYLSGCFMFVRATALQAVGLFDERYFLYFEDVDLARRLHSRYPTLYFPGATVYHGYRRGSSGDRGLFLRLAVSGWRYFSKWGWVHDPDRRRLNNRCLKELGYV